MTTLFKYVQAQNFSLAGAGAIAGATSITLKSFVGIDGALLTMTDFGVIGFATIEPGNGVQEEQISFTGVVQNANGTATLTGVSTVLFVNPYTAVSGLAKTHAGFTTFIITNTAGFYDQFPAKANDETITGQWTFSVFPITPANTPATTVALGIVLMSVAPAVAGSPTAVGTNDNRVPVAYAVDSVGSDSYAITPSPAITAYAAGQRFTFKAGTANTGSASLAVSGLAAKTLKKYVTDDLVTGDILANQIVEVIYDSVSDTMKVISMLGFISPIIRVYTANDTWTKPAGLKYIIVEVVGGGGGGGGSTTQANGGGGGGGGGYSRELLLASVLGATEGVTVGAAGTAGAGTGGTGGTGGTSSFGTVAFLQATGGVGGTAAAVGGVGGVGSNGTLNIEGSDGGGGTKTSAAADMGGSTGGSSHYGGGGAGGVQATAAKDGNNYGGGGGGGAGDGNDSAGGAGAAGVVIVTEYYQ